MDTNIESDPKEIIQNLVQYKKKISLMDLRVREFLSNREKHRHPNHEGLINEIRKYEKQIYRLSNTEIQLHLDNLMSFLLTHEQSWKQLFLKDAERRR